MYAVCLNFIKFSRVYSWTFSMSYREKWISLHIFRPEIFMTSVWMILKLRPNYAKWNFITSHIRWNLYSQFAKFIEFKIKISNESFVCLLKGKAFTDEHFQTRNFNEFQCFHVSTLKFIGFSGTLLSDGTLLFNIPIYDIIKWSKVIKLGKL